MSLKDKLRQLFGDAKIVWGSSDARRPFTRRGMTQEELLNEGKALDKEDGGRAKTDHSPPDEGRA